MQSIQIKPTFIKPNIVKKIYFSLKNTKTLLLKNEINDLLFFEKPQAQFLLKLKRYFTFLEL